MPGYILLVILKHMTEPLRFTINKKVVSIHNTINDFTSMIKKQKNLMDSTKSFNYHNNNKLCVCDNYFESEHFEK